MLSALKVNDLGPEAQAMPEQLLQSAGSGAVSIEHFEGRIPSWVIRQFETQSGHECHPMPSFRQSIG